MYPSKHKRRRIGHKYRVSRTQNNLDGGHNYTGDGQFINNGRNQNVNTGPGSFSINGHVAQSPVQDEYEQTTVTARTPAQNQALRSHSDNPGILHREITPVLDHLQELLRSIFADETRLKTFLKQKGHPAQVWLDRMQELADYPNTSPELRPSIFTIMLRLSNKSGLHPTCLMIQNVRKIGDYPVAAGGFGDVWKGVIGSSTVPVCLKIVKIYLKSDVEKSSQEYIREAVVWRQLKHPNLLPFLGIYRLEHNRQLCLISPWMEKGNLVQYLRSTPREDVKHYTLVHDVAAGLHYLHIMKFVHGDLKGVNVLITLVGRACIGDFGLSRVADTHGLQITTSTSRPAGTARWLAPELLIGGGTSKQSDIYAYGCVCYEIFTGLHPFPELPHEMAVAFHVAQGKRMSRPEHITELTNDMWVIMESCWSADPSARPSVEDVLSRVKVYVQDVTDAGLDWSDTLSREIWNNVEHPAMDPDEVSVLSNVGQSVVSENEKTEGQEAIDEVIYYGYVQDEYNQSTGTPAWNQSLGSHNDGRRNPFHQFNRPTPRRTRTDTEILEWMKTLVGNETRLGQFLALREAKAEWALEDMQRASYSLECDPLMKSSILKVMIQLCDASSRSIQCHCNPNVQKLGGRPFSPNGTFADVWKGRIGDNSQIVALKVVRQEYAPEVGENFKTHMREIIKWRMLDHSNVLPFIGNFYLDTSPQEICLVTPWMENGNLVEYLQNNRPESLKRFAFAWDVANGLEYLHKLDITHGNLKGNNILITSDEVACIADFGLTYILNDGGMSGHVRPTPWRAREVLAEGTITQKSDIYAYGCVCYEIFAERKPFHNLSNLDELYQVIVVQKQIPERPVDLHGPMPWEVMERCWDANPSSRPAASDIMDCYLEQRYHLLDVLD